MTDVTPEATPAATGVTPQDIQDVADRIDDAAGDQVVQSVETRLASHIPKGVRGAIYEGGKWVGVVGAVVALIAGSLEGTPALYTTAIASVFLAASGFVAKAHLSD